MSHEITQKLVVIIACYAVLAFVGTRRWLRSTEAVVLGVAMIFWAIAWLMASLVKVTVPLYGPGWRSSLIAFAMTIPMTLAMAVGLWFLARRIQRDVSASPPASNPPRRRKRTRGVK